MQQVKVARPKYLVRNLVYLVFSANPCYTRVVGRRPSGVEVNAKDGFYTVHGDRFKIGERAYYTGRPVIGVYDRTKIPHLESMMAADRDVTFGPSRPFDD